MEHFWTQKNSHNVHLEPVEWTPKVIRSNLKNQSSASFGGEVETILITVSIRIFISYLALGRKGLIENHTGLSESELRREFKFKVGVCPMNEDV